jgi:Clp amino terminal domain, pathogenicity island component
MIAQKFLRSVSRWLTRHHRAGSCGKGAEAGMNQGGGFDRFTERTRHVMRLAQEEAQRLQHHYLGTEHPLLGLLREGEGIGAEVLESFGLSLQEVRANIIQVLNQKGGRYLFAPFAANSKTRSSVSLPDPEGSTSATNASRS